MHVAADLGTQAVNDLIQGLRAGGVHADEELVLVFVHPRRTGLDVRQVDAFVLQEDKGAEVRAEMENLIFFVFILFIWSFSSPEGSK